VPGSKRRTETPEPLFPRRTLLKGSAAIGGGISALVWGVGLGVAGPARGVPQWFKSMQDGTPIATPEAVETYQPIALTEAEAVTLRAITNRIIPPDDLGPGAGDAGAVIYIDWTLAGPGAALLGLYQGGIAVLDANAGEGGFAAADTATQDALLAQAEAGELADFPEGFFPLLIEHTRQAMFGDPMYGGNIGFAGWDLIQYPGLKLTWTPEEQALDVIVTPAHRSVAEQGGTPYDPTTA
jgi:gluconate 2-dehydrogenase gamma chain